MSSVMYIYYAYVILIAADHKLFGLDHALLEGLYLDRYISDAKIRMTKIT